MSEEKEKNQVEKIEKEIEKPDDEETLNIPETLPVLVLRDIVVFPYMIVPLYVGRIKSKRAVDKVLNSDRMILLLTQRDPNVEVIVVSGYATMPTTVETIKKGSYHFLAKPIISPAPKSRSAVRPFLP